MRPQLFTYVLFATMVVVLDRAQTSRRMLFVIPPLFVLWANLHGGAVAGWCFCTLYLGCRSLEALRARGSAAWGDVRLFALVCLAAVLAILLTRTASDASLGAAGHRRAATRDHRVGDDGGVIHFPGWAGLIAVIAVGVLGGTGAPSASPARA